MDDRTAQKMHALLDHKDGEHPASCPVCKKQAAERPPIVLEAPSIVRERSTNG